MCTCTNTHLFLHLVFLFKVKTSKLRSSVLLTETVLKYQEIVLNIVPSVISCLKDPFSHLFGHTKIQTIWKAAVCRP